MFRGLAYVLLLAGTWSGQSVMADRFAEHRAMCEPLMTIVKEDCQVENYYRCAGDKTYYQVYPIGANQRAYLVDADFQTIFALDVQTNESLGRAQETRDPFLVRELLATGIERSEVLIDTSVIPGVERLSWTQGTFHLLDEELIIDDQAFAMIDVKEVAEIGYGGQVAQMGTTYLYHRDTGVMTDHERSMIFMGSTMTIPVSVERVIMKNTFGFMSDDPEAFCTEQLSALSSQDNPYLGETQ